MTTESCIWSSEPISREFLAAILDHIAHPVFVKDRDFRFVLLNEAFVAMVGHPRSAMFGKSDFDFFPKEEAEFFRKKDAEMFATGATVDIEEESITDGAGKRHVLATTKVPLRDPNGEVTHLVGIIHDITQIKEAEGVLRDSNVDLERRVRERTQALTQVQAALVRRERLAVLGQLSGSLAHQIKNPLSAITSAVYVLQRMTSEIANPELKRAIQIVHEEAWRANRIITDVTEFARVRPPSRRLIACDSIVDLALKPLTIDDGLKIVRIRGDVPPVWVDVDQVEGALGNILRNALEAMPQRGTITIETKRDEEMALIRVTDTGHGIDPSVMAQLFEPLITTKTSGLGLGLTTARNLVRNQGGTIEVSTVGGEGTTISIRLPFEHDETEEEEDE